MRNIVCDITEKLRKKDINNISINKIIYKSINDVFTTKIEN